MDHTLIRYKREFRKTRAPDYAGKAGGPYKVIQKVFLDLDSSFDRAIRGLVIDEVRGNILKLVSATRRFASAITAKTSRFPKPQSKFYKFDLHRLARSDYETVDNQVSLDCVWRVFLCSL